MKVYKCDSEMFFVELKVLFDYHIPCLQGREVLCAMAEWL